jgi:hypothetical protein
VAAAGFGSHFVTVLLSAFGLTFAGVVIVVWGLAGHREKDEL